MSITNLWLKGTRLTAPVTEFEHETVQLVGYVLDTSTSIKSRRLTEAVRSAFNLSTDPFRNGDEPCWMAAIGVNPGMGPIAFGEMDGVVKEVRSAYNADGGGTHLCYALGNMATALLEQFRLFQAIGVRAKLNLFGLTDGEPYKDPWFKNGSPTSEVLDAFTTLRTTVPRANSVAMGALPVLSDNPTQDEIEDLERQRATLQGIFTALNFRHILMEEATQAKIRGMLQQASRTAFGPLLGLPPAAPAPADPAAAQPGPGQTVYAAPADPAANPNATGILQVKF